MQRLRQGHLSPKSRRLLSRWQEAGGSREVLAESLRILSHPPRLCELFDVPKWMRPKIRHIAYEGWQWHALTAAEAGALARRVRQGRPADLSL